MAEYDSILQLVRSYGHQSCMKLNCAQNGTAVLVLADSELYILSSSSSAYRPRTNT